MTPFERWSLPILLVQTLISFFTVAVAALAIDTWKRQIDYGHQNEIQKRLMRLVLQCISCIKEARDRDFYHYLPQEKKADFKISPSEEPLFSAIYSSFDTLDRNSEIFDELGRAAIDFEVATAVKITDEISEIRSLRNLLMTTSIKAAKLRFGGKDLTVADEEELQLLQKSIFARPSSDEISVRLETLRRSITAKVLATEKK